VLSLPNPDATARFAALIAPLLVPGDILLIDGDLGAGKTTFTRALVAALAGDPASVSSPSFTLLHEYDARFPVVHVDAWRLADAGELDGLGFDEARDGGIAVIEWAARVADGLDVARCWRLRLDHAPDGGRTVCVTAPDDRAALWLQAAAGWPG
jgi:tRNA threonylcarbamoyl adenosine modification protein YjeE